MKSLSRFGFYFELFIFLLVSVQVQSAAPNFEIFCHELLQKEPMLSDYSAYFQKDFQTAVPLDVLKAIFSQLYSEAGACTSFKVIPVTQSKYQLFLMGEKKINVLFDVFYNESSALFSGLRIIGLDDPSIQIQSWSDLQLNLQKLDSSGKLSATLKTSDGLINLLYNESDEFAIGSTFKLYILGALEQSIARGEHNWDELLSLKEEWKSLPSGVMHEWPTGKPIKLYEYAEKMISLSDNTATDHLLYFLGRDTIEKMLSPMGNEHEQSHLPFLSTLEMFKLKWALPVEETNKYLKLNKVDRLEILNKLVKIPRSHVGTNGVDFNKPVLINQLEWFATTPENCDAMFWLASKNNSSVRSILSKSLPILSDVGTEASHWSYAGYKGGSEPGVLSMTFLLESKKGNRACLSMSWNNQKEEVSHYRFMDIIRKTLLFAETKIP